jgi:hypothetical protein
MSISYSRLGTRFIACVATTAALVWLGSSKASSVELPKPPGKAKPAAPRKITVLRYEQHDPLFSRAAKTLDPTAVAQQGWKGYLSKMGSEVEGAAGSPLMFRLHFDSRALPWASIKEASIDGFDVNTRNVGAHAALHAMLGRQKREDPVEAAQLAYIQSLEPEGKGSFIRHGELAENLIDLYHNTGDENYRRWAAKVVRALHPPVDSSDPMGGWLHLHVGWNIGAFTKWYALSGEKEYLDKALACFERVTNSRDSHGDDGAFRPDGSFGGKSQTTTASWHMHGHTHIVPGMLILGEQLLKDGQTEQGLKAVAQARRICDWLYDPTQNPDAGSLTGWLGEWLMVGTGWDRTSDCEGCTMGDVVEIACALGASSRSHPDLVNQEAYYDLAEQFFRGQVVESVFQPNAKYSSLMQKCIAQRVAKNAIGSVIWRDRGKKKRSATLAMGDVQQRRTKEKGKSAPYLDFEGNAYFKLDDSAALRLPQFTLYAMVNVREGGPQTIYANYDNPINWGKGVSLGLTPDRRLSFFTTDGTEANYDVMLSPAALPAGWHMIVARYAADRKELYVDGDQVAQAPAKPLDYGAGSVAAIGALREFSQYLNGSVAELILTDAVDEADRRAVESYLEAKYRLDSAAPETSTAMGDPHLWLSADDGYERERPHPSSEERKAEADRLYEESLKTAGRLEGRLLGLCGFNDWVNNFPSTLDPALPGIDMMGCCSDAVMRAAGAIWRETVTGTSAETRVNFAFNRFSPLVDVVSSLPHRGELNIFVKDAKKVLIRVPGWAPKEKVKVFVDQKPIDVTWQDSYVVFNAVTANQQLTVTYPLRIAEIKETVGSLEGARFTEKWRGNTIVDISPPGRFIPMYLRPELDTDELPPLTIAP